MGSYPQIADKRGTHDLYGPVNRVMCAGYDRAMVTFLTCVKVSASTMQGSLAVGMGMLRVDFHKGSLHQFAPESVLMHC